jgi:hypothetical protein
MALDAELTRTLRELVLGRSVAALGTLHAGEPFVSMVPYALHGPGITSSSMSARFRPIPATCSRIRA